MHNIPQKYMPLFEGAGMGGGAGAGGEGSGGEGGGGAGGWTPPEGLPKDFVGADASESLTKLIGGYTDMNTRFTGMRDKLAKMPTPPESPDAYKYEPSEKLKPFFGDMATNPVFKQAREAFHKHGIPEPAFAGVIEDLYGPLIEQGAIEAPFDPAKELKTFQEAYGLDRENAAAALTEAETFAKGLTAQLKDLPPGMKDQVGQLMLGLTDTAAGNVLLKALSGRLAENGIRIAGEGAGDGNLTAADVKKLSADPRIDPANRDNPDPNKRFDPDLRQRYDDWYRENSK
jgi:hypothetical protein